MSETLLDIFQWYGAAAGLLAAFIVSLNLGTRPTGWAFVIFVTSSIALIAWGFLNDEGSGIGWQNVGLLVINVIGVYRYLLAKPRQTGKTDQPEPA
ncbi:hypothetical protein ACXYL9_01010 [Qipengyuania sp. CAU 1752]